MFPLQWPTRFQLRKEELLVLIGLNKVPWSQMVCGYMREMETCEGGLYLGIEGNLVMIMKSC